MTDETANGAAQPAAAAAQPQLNLQQMYVKDASFEAPGAPQIFQEQGQPQLQLNLGQKVATLAEGVYEVVLSATVTCTINEKTAYLAEAHQAAVFSLNGFDQQNLEGVLATYCPNVLFPYLRLTISNMIQAGGFPPFLLQPINFEQVYMETLRRRSEEQQAPVDSTFPPGNA